MKLNIEFGKKVGFLKENESTLEDIANRIAPVVASIETPEKREEWKNKFWGAISAGSIIPAGRIIRNISIIEENGIKTVKVGQLSNCFILAVSDDIYSIGQLNHDITVISSCGGGFGVNFSELRPEGDEIKGRGGESTGPISFMRMINAIGGEVKSGGNRRSAGAVILNVDHPDIYKFIEAKLEHHQLTNLNISVGITNEFLNTVKNNDNWDLKFRGKIYKTVKAKELWDYLIECAIKSAEPGFVNLSNIRYYNPGNYFEKIDSQNPCQELPGEANTACALTSINIHNFVKNGELNKEELGNTTKIAQRFLDNIITICQYPLPINKQIAEKNRRIGIGVIGFAHALIEMKIRYGSEECLEFIDEVWSIIRDNAYIASTETAKEKGFFPAYTPAYLDTPYIKRLPRNIRTKIKEYGIRNVAMLSCPPTGDTGIFTNLSTGIEPIPSKKFKRAGKHIFLDPIYEKYQGNKEYEPYFVGMYEVTPKEHLEVQAHIQKYVDNSISKTVNVAKNKVDDFKKAILNELYNLKGTTVYVEGSRKEHISIEDTGECSGGVCQVDKPVE